MNIESVVTLFEEELKDLYDAEKQLVRALPKVAKAATTEDLRVAEGEAAIEQDGEDILRDVMLIGAAKRVEHYEMAGYQSAILLADSMGIEEAADLLRQTLTEEEEADEKLESLCEQLLENRASETELEGGVDTEDHTRKTARTKASRGV